MTVTVLPPARAGRGSCPGTRLTPGRVALVTNGTRGLGEAICRELAGDGAHVVAGHWHDDEGAEKFLASMTADFPRQAVAVYDGDVSDPDGCRRAVQEVVGQFGQLDILASSPWPGDTPGPVLPADSGPPVTAGLDVACLLAEAAFEHMLARGTGRIITVCPEAGAHPATGTVGADGADATVSLTDLTRTLSQQAIAGLRPAAPPEADIGLTVNVVTPVDPPGSPAGTEEIVQAVGFLAGDQASFITGQIWAADAR